MATRSGIQLAVPFEERRLLNQGRFQLKWHPPYLVQPKLNGERCRMIVEGGRCLLLSSSEDIIPAVPHINKAGLSFPPGEYDGELYVHGWTWAEIHSVVSREQNIHLRNEEMQLWLFDIISSEPQSERIKRLNEIVRQDTFPIARVHTQVAWTLSELLTIYDQYIEAGFEGFILRHIDALYRRSRSQAMMKFKPKQKDSYLIVSIYEAISEEDHPMAMVGGFNCIDPEGTPFSVGAGKLTHDQRRSIWQNWLDAPHEFTGRHLEIEYQTMSDSKRVPLFSRAVRIL